LNHDSVAFELCYGDDTKVKKKDIIDNSFWAFGRATNILLNSEELEDLKTKFQ